MSFVYCGLCFCLWLVFDTSDGFVAISHSFSRKFGPSYCLPLSSRIPLPGDSVAFVDRHSNDLEPLNCQLIKCYHVEDRIYGIGKPVDSKVVIVNLIDDDFVPIQTSKPDFREAFDHIQSQMEDYDIELLNTPVVMTCRGEFDDDSNKIFLPPIPDGEYSLTELYEIEESLEKNGTYSEYYRNEEDEDNDDENDDTNDDEPDVETLEDVTSDDIKWISENCSGISELSIGDPSSEYYVTEDDEKSLQRWHRVADRYFSEVDNVTLIGSYHFKKKNYHLVKIMDPIIVVGLYSAKDQQFSLLSDVESSKVMPILENMIVQDSSQSTFQANDVNRLEIENEQDEDSDNNHPYIPQDKTKTITTPKIPKGTSSSLPSKSKDKGKFADSNNSLRTSKRRWIPRSSNPE